MFCFVFLSRRSYLTYWLEFMSCSRTRGKWAGRQYLLSKNFIFLYPLFLSLSIIFYSFDYCIYLCYLVIPIRVRAPLIKPVHIWPFSILVPRGCAPFGQRAAPGDEKAEKSSCWNLRQWNIWTTPSLPHFNDAKMARFCSFAPSLIALEGWGFTVPIYFVHARL